MKKHSFAIKVCGITRQSDLSTAMGMGAHFCGFVFHPKSPRYIAPERAAALDSALIRRVGVFVNQDAEQIMDIMKTARLEFAQLHGQPVPGLRAPDRRGKSHPGSVAGQL